MAEHYVVTATGLNLRSAPVVKPSTRIVTLDEGEIVTRIAAAEDPLWWRVAAEVDGVRFEGFVKHEYLAATGAVPQPAAAPAAIPAVHLVPKGPIRRDRAQGWAYPLNEDAQPHRESVVSAASLASIIDWLDVERHARYLPIPSATYCNIYAYDYCYLGGGFLPRVWWTPAALQRIAGGEAVTPQYGKTVRELSANSLYDWLGDHGHAFGWRRVATPGELQDAANAGRLALICAKNKNVNVSGHIVAVVPETGGAGAIRAADGTVRVPLQSQAGRRNFRYGRKDAWWRAARFSAFGYWVLA